MYNTDKMLFMYKDRRRVAEFLLHLKKIQQMMPNNMEIQHKHMKQEELDCKPLSFLFIHVRATCIFYNQCVQ